MRVRSRIITVIAAVITAAPVGALAPAAAAPSVRVAAELVFVNIHIRAQSGANGPVAKCLDSSPFGDPRSSCTLRGNFDGGHTTGWNDVAGSVSWRNSGGGDQRTDVTITTDKGATIVGRLPNRQSDRFTVREFNVPGVGTIAGGDGGGAPGTRGGPMYIDVRNYYSEAANFYVYDFYVRGYPPIERGRTGGVGAGGPLAGLFGSS